MDIAALVAPNWYLKARREGQTPDMLRGELQAWLASSGGNASDEAVSLNIEIYEYALTAANQQVN